MRIIAVWQREWLGDERDSLSVLDRQLGSGGGRWRGSGGVGLSDGSAASGGGEWSWGWVWLVLDGGLHAGLVGLCRGTGTTLLMVAHAALARCCRGWVRVLIFRLVAGGWA